MTNKSNKTQSNALNSSQVENNKVIADSKNQAIENVQTGQKATGIEKKQSAVKTETPVHIYDSIVVGAGISGIAAAIKLKKAHYDNIW